MLAPCCRLLCDGRLPATRSQNKARPGKVSTWVTSRGCRLSPTSKPSCIARDANLSETKLGLDRHSCVFLRCTAAADCTMSTGRLQHHPQCYISRARFQCKAGHSCQAQLPVSALCVLSWSQLQQCEASRDSTCNCKDIAVSDVFDLSN